MFSNGLFNAAIKGKMDCTFEGIHMRRIIVPICISLVFTINACAPIPDAPNFSRGLNALEERNYAVAYRFFEDVRPHEISKVIAIIEKNPQVIDAGFQTFSISALNDSINRYGFKQSAEIEFNRLESFKRYASQEKYQEAKLNLNEVFASEIAEINEKLDKKKYLESLPSDERAAHYAELYKKYQDSIKVIGRVMSAQLINRSSQGTNTGSAFGALVGQAVYIDSINFRNYSAGNQIAAGLIGAAVGSSFDQRKIETYQKVYFIKKKEGEIVRLDQNTSDPVLYPVGACISYKEPFEFNIIEDKNC